MTDLAKARKVSIHVSEGALHHGVPVSSQILDFLYFRGVAGATVLKGIAGFGADHRIHTGSSVELSDSLPLTIEFVESAEKVDALMERLQELAGKAVIEVQETTVMRPGAPSEKTVPKSGVEHVKIEGRARMMRIYISEHDKWRDRPLYLALLEAMRANEIAGATVYRGVLGYGAHGRVHRDKPLHLTHDASMMLSAIDSEVKLTKFMPLIDEMVQEGLVVLSDVDIIRYTHRPVETS
jgi:PII-like signaling protein